MRHGGVFPNRPDHIARLAERLGRNEPQLSFCYEAGPCGYGLQRQLTKLGHDCIVVAPSLIPMKAGDRVKTDDAMRSCWLSCIGAGELTSVCIPDDAHEAMCDPIRAHGSVPDARPNTFPHQRL
ncbi:transposase [Nitrobacter sp. Nb-311A]|nr:transposase [Nitrobacter sp. Nb-311A]EAQ36513.1 transposase [Nitrobacter sp. Nb-311A]